MTTINEEKICTIIMQAIAPYHKPYKYLGEKSIETAKNEIMQSFHQELQKARREILHKLYLCAIGKYQGDALENVKAQIKEYQSELDQPITSDKTNGL